MRKIIEEIKLLWKIVKTVIRFWIEGFKWAIKYKVPFFVRKRDVREINDLDENGRFEGIIYDRKKNRDCYFAFTVDFDEDDSPIIDLDYGVRDHLES